MQEGLHPAYEKMTATCNCGNTFETRSTLGKSEVRLDVCSACHPFYTGNYKIIDTTRRVQRFEERYKRAKSQDDQTAGDQQTH